MTDNEEEKKNFVCSLGKDAVCEEFKNKKGKESKVWKFSAAVDLNLPDTPDEDKEPPMWFQVKSFEPLDDHTGIVPNLKKGDIVEVWGSKSVHEYQDKTTGEQKSINNLVLDKIVLVKSRADARKPFNPKDYDKKPY